MFFARVARSGLAQLLLVIPLRFSGRRQPAKSVAMTAVVTVVAGLVRPRGRRDVRVTTPVQAAACHLEGRGFPVSATTDRIADPTAQGRVLHFDPWGAACGEAGFQSAFERLQSGWWLAMTSVSRRAHLTAQFLRLEETKQLFERHRLFQYGHARRQAAALLNLGLLET